jgi:hypothetical protein
MTLCEIYKQVGHFPFTVKDGYGVLRTVIGYAFYYEEHNNVRAKGNYYKDNNHGFLWSEYNKWTYIPDEATTLKPEPTIVQRCTCGGATAKTTCSHWCDSLQKVG